VLPPLIAIVGPTASGKSSLALRVARAQGGEIVSCDSLQVYRGLDIGSAKATLAERRDVRHHLIDVVDPAEAFSAAEYSRLARTAIAGITNRHRLPIVAGGTGLYLRALLEGLFDGPARDEGRRRRLESLAERFGDHRLHRLLRSLDPDAAERIRPADRVRVVRALEVYWATGRPITEHHGAGAEPLQGHRILLLGLDPDREALRRVVEKRTHAMLAAGLVDEVRRLLDAGLPPTARPLQAIGYRDALAVVKGKSTPEQAGQAIVTATMRFAKRQMTWFRHQADVTWFKNADTAYTAALTWLG
jgi:tRNA dimethylallyltransferase